MKFENKILIAVMVMLGLLLGVSAAHCAINDPGAGEATRALRRTARVTAWQAIYEGLTDEQIQNQARVALYDFVDQVCIEEKAANRMGGTPSQPEIQEWIEDEMSALAATDRMELLTEKCPGGAPYTPEEDDQGGVYDRVLIIRATAVADGIRAMLPVLPRIGSVAPLAWGTMSEGTCTVGGTSGTCYASHYAWHEATVHLLEAIVLAEGRADNFALAPLATWREDVQWTDVSP